MKELSVSTIPVTNQGFNLIFISLFLASLFKEKSLFESIKYDFLAVLYFNLVLKRKVLYLFSFILCNKHLNREVIATLGSSKNRIKLSTVH